MSTKLGLLDSAEEENKKLVQNWLNFLDKSRLDFTQSFRSLSKLVSNEPDLDEFSDEGLSKDFLEPWRQKLKTQFDNINQAKEHLDSKNPWVIPRNHMVEQAIQAGYERDFQPLKEMLSVLENPFEEQSKFEIYAKAPNESEKVLRTFCGT